MIVSEGIRDQVIAANRAFYDAFSARDLDAMAACWGDGDDVACIHPGGRVIKGWDLVRSSWEAILAGDEDFVVDVEVVDVHFEDPVAWVTCMERMSAFGHGGRGGPEIVATNVFVLGSAGWRMTLHHASPVL